MTDPTLPPAAQAVLDALYMEELNGPQQLMARAHAAAALRAAADQVVPEDYSSYTGHPEHDFAMEARNDSAREAILAIAAELEAQ
jgi:hypothetical protein